MDLSGPGIDVKLKERKKRKERKFPPQVQLGSKSKYLLVLKFFVDFTFSFFQKV
jgi:hypothetical protein